MKNIVKSGKVLTYSRKKRRKETTDSEDSISISSGCDYETVDYSSCDSLVADCLSAHQRMESIFLAETNSDLRVPSFSVDFPRRRRSKRSVICLNKDSFEEGCCKAGILIERPFQLHLTAHGHPRASRRRKITQGDGQLDSDTFERHLEKLWQSFAEERRTSFTHLDSLWYAKYINDFDKETVLSWIKKRDIFSKKYVMVPVVQWGHWSLLIFCHFGESLESKTRTPCILLLDSLQMTGPKRLEPGIRKYVLDIYRAEKRPENEKLLKKMRFLVPKVPQQKNGEDCGFFVLYYMNLFVENAPDNFSVSEGYPYFMKKDWFNLEALDCFCRGLDDSSCS